MLKTKKILKKKLSIALVAVMLISSLFTMIANAVVLNDSEQIIFTESIEYDGLLYEILYPIEVSDNIFVSSVIENDNKITTVYNGNNNTLEYIYTSGEDDIITNQYTITIDDTPFASNAETRVINQRTERTFGYGWYYNTDSANLDRYWRLYCPDASPSSNFFFTAIPSNEQARCEDFVLAVNAMDTQGIIAEQEIKGNKFNAVINALNVISDFPSISEMFSTLVGISGSTSGNGPLNLLYENKNKAYTLYSYLLK